jgi:hypothetical protein
MGSARARALFLAVEGYEGTPVDFGLQVAVDPEPCVATAAVRGIALQLCSCRWGHQFKLGLFRDDFVYGINDSGVYSYAAMAAGAVGS